AATQILGAPTKADRRTSFGDSTLDVRLSWDDDRVAIRLRSGNNGPEATLMLKGAVVATVADALDKQIETDNKNAAAKAEAARRTELCTCKHLSVGQDWPPRSPGQLDPAIMGHASWTITALDPKTCTATLRSNGLVNASGGVSGSDEKKSCADLG